MRVLRIIAEFLCDVVCGWPRADVATMQPLVKRSPLWASARKSHLKREPRCRACGSAANVAVHHKKPVHAYPALELEPTNHITLCEGAGINCHYTFGHLGNWRSWNENVEADADAFFKKVSARPFA